MPGVRTVLSGSSRTLPSEGFLFADRASAQSNGPAVVFVGRPQLSGIDQFKLRTRTLRPGRADISKPTVSTVGTRPMNPRVPEPASAGEGTPPQLRSSVEAWASARAKPAPSPPEPRSGVSYLVCSLALVIASDDAPAEPKSLPE